MIFENFDLPECNRKCYRGYKQTFKLLNIHAGIVENNTFRAKYLFLTILENATSGVQNVV